MMNNFIKRLILLACISSSSLLFAVAEVFLAWSTIAPPKFDIKDYCELHEASEEEQTSLLTRIKFSQETLNERLKTKGLLPLLIKRNNGTYQVKRFKLNLADTIHNFEEKIKDKRRKGWLRAYFSEKHDLEAYKKNFELYKKKQDFFSNLLQAKSESQKSSHKKTVSKILYGDPINSFRYLTDEEKKRPLYIEVKKFDSQAQFKIFRALRLSATEVELSLETAKTPLQRKNDILSNELITGAIDVLPLLLIPSIKR